MPAAVARARSANRSRRRGQPTRHAIRLTGVLRFGMEPDGNSKKLLRRDRSAPVGLRVVTGRRAASHWGHAEKRASRIRTRRFGEVSFVALMRLPVALLFA